MERRPLFAVLGACRSTGRAARRGLTTGLLIVTVLSVGLPAGADPIEVLDESDCTATAVIDSGQGVTAKVGHNWVHSRSCVSSLPDATHVKVRASVEVPEFTATHARTALAVVVREVGGPVLWTASAFRETPIEEYLEGLEGCATQPPGPDTAVCVLLNQPLYHLHHAHVDTNPIALQNPGADVECFVWGTVAGRFDCDLRVRT